MTDGLRPYPGMKDSGVAWLGEVPAHWKVQRLRNLTDMCVSNVDKHAKDGEQPVRLCNYVDVYRNDYIRPSMSFMRATATKDEIERFRLAEGDVLITKDSEAWNDIGVPALVRESADDLVSGYHLALLRPFRGRIVGEFLFRSLQSAGVQYQFHVEANGVTRYGLSHAAIKSVWLPAPPLPEQAAIVRFLDHADRRIRRYIRAKQKLIKLLEEQKQAIIHRAVTRGLDPNVRLKPSGVEWLGDVPEHWEVRKLRQCGSISGGMTPSMADRSLWDGDVPWVTPKDMKRATIAAASMNVSRRALEVTSLRLIRSGSVLLVVRGMILARRVPIARTVQPVTINQDMKAIVPAAGIDAGYLAYRMDATQATFASMIDEAGHGTKRFPTERWKNIVLAVPPVNEQRQIVSYIDQATAQLAGAVDVAEREIELLREYRTRLIADVVTGKLDVREAAARLPQEAEDLEPLDETEVLGEMEGESAADDLEPESQEAEA
jgi:type I restriction enzyme S subunit